MKIYTRTGDKGTTSLVYGERVSKADKRVEAYGTCDEANSMIGLALSLMKDELFEGKELFDRVFHKIQTTLFHVGAEIATPKGKEVKWFLKEEDIKELEEIIDVWDSSLSPLTQFILPSGHPAGASLHVSRTIVRRAERCAVELGEDVSQLVTAYLNRLSDLLFVAARYVNDQLGETEKNLHD